MAKLVKINALALWVSMFGTTRLLGKEDESSLGVPIRDLKETEFQEIPVSSQTQVDYGKNGHKLTEKRTVLAAAKERINRELVKMSDLRVIEPKSGKFICYIKDMIPKWESGTVSLATGGGFEIAPKLSYYVPKGYIYYEVVE